MNTHCDTCALIQSVLLLSSFPSVTSVHACVLHDHRLQVIHTISHQLLHTMLRCWTSCNDYNMRHKIAVCCSMQYCMQQLCLPASWFAACLAYWHCLGHPQVTSLYSGPGRSMGELQDPIQASAASFSSRSCSSFLRSCSFSLCSSATSSRQTSRAPGCL